MKHIRLSAALMSIISIQSVPAGAGGAINITKMDFYPPRASSPSFTDPSVSGSVNASANGSFKSGTPFFGIPWTANQQVWFDTTGKHTWKGTSASGAYNYSFTLAKGQVAAGVYFTWSVNTDIPVLVVFDCGGGKPGDSCTPVDTDGDGAPGTAMQTPPFPGQTPAFSGFVSTDLGLGGTGGSIADCQNNVCDTTGAKLSGGVLDPDKDGFVSLSELISAGIPEDKKAHQMCVGGCFDFIKTGVSGSSTFIIKLKSPIPPAPKYRKWDGKQWSDFDISTGDSISSANLLPNGKCPGTTSKYATGLLKGRECIKLVISDNGPNDSDPTNGTIADPGGVIEVEQPDPKTSLGKAFGSINGAGCTLSAGRQDPRAHLEWLLLAIGGALLGTRNLFRKR